MLIVSSMPNVREFLARALPWPQPGGQTSYVNIHYKMPAPNPTPNHETIIPGRPCTTVEGAARQVQYFNDKDGGTDIYVCMAAQSTAEQVISRKGKPYLKAVRRAEHTTAVKSLFVDVDVKPEDLKHGYATTEEAVTEFTRIRKELALPPPSFIIKSGSGGFHAHWTFAEAIGPDRWRKLSQAFMGGLSAKGFRGDSQCVVDIVRLLRLPGTFNHKGGTKRPVVLFMPPGPDYFVEHLETALAPYVGLYAPAVAKPVAVLGPPVALFAKVTLPALDTGLELLRPTIDQVAAGCPFIAATLAVGGANNPNPLWLQTTNVALFCEDSRTATHRLSSGYKTYDMAATDALFDRQLDTKQRRNLGWPRCQTIASYGAKECQTCPHLAANKSPLGHAVLPAEVTAALVKPFVPAAPTLPSTLAPLPTAYGYDNNGLVCLVTTDDNGVQEYKPVCSFIMEKPWLQQEPPVLNFTTHTHVGHEKQIRLPYEAITDKSSLPKTLARQGMLVHGGEVRQLGDFMVSWVEKMRADRANVVQSQPFGWVTHEGKLDGFVYAGHIWSPGVPRPAANPDPVLGAQYTPSGDLAAWSRASKMITDQQRPEIDAILASAFAAPLVRFTGQTGLLMTTYSTESGIGKSTALKVAQAVWGHPQKAVQSLNDTQNSVLKKIGDIKSLPLFWDELKTSEDTEQFVRLAFQLSQGKEKSRLASDTSYREPGTWQTLLCSTSNGSVLAAVLAHTKTTAAGLYRVFEYVVTPPGPTGQIGSVDAQLITANLNDNYGYAGLAYAQFLGANHERVAREVAELAKQVEHHYKVRADERFWLALVVTIISGAKYSNELGLTDINYNKLSQFMMDRFQDMRQARRTTTVDVNEGINVLAYLARYLNESRRAHTVYTTNVHRTQGRAPIFTHGNPGSITLSGKTNETLIRSVRIQIGENDHWIRMAKAPFDEWLEEQQVAPRIITNLLEINFGVKVIHSRMCAGTALVTAKEYLLEFNYGDPVFRDLIEL